MVREIITIDRETCNGCGQCVPNCPEGAIQMIDGKARLISDLFCDGLGACIGECPVGAITIEKREAEPYDERRVMENIVLQGPNVIKAHLDHLEHHGETGYLETALRVLHEKGIEPPAAKREAHAHHAGCPGSRMREIDTTARETEAQTGTRASMLAQWPVQLHLVPPRAPYFKNAELLLSADCVAYSVGDFHKDHLNGRALAIACPKLDTGQDVYLDKLTAMIDEGGLSSITVMTMEVPCCRGLLQLAVQAVERAERKIPVNWVNVSVEGGVKSEQRLV